MLLYLFDDRLSAVIFFYFPPLATLWCLAPEGPPRCQLICSIDALKLLISNFIYKLMTRSYGRSLRWMAGPWEALSFTGRSLTSTAKSKMIAHCVRYNSHTVSLTADFFFYFPFNGPSVLIHFKFVRTFCPHLIGPTVLSVVRTDDVLVLALSGRTKRLLDGPGYLALG